MRVNICAGQAAAFRAKLALSRARASGSGLASSVSWWRNAVMYEVYLRSFADGDGDGIGDIPGLRSRLPYLRDLGVDGILVTPWYPSPMKDGGYDVSSYVGIEPLFGTLADARELINDAHRNDLKVIVDFVANHTSDQHPWFKRALAAAPGRPATTSATAKGRAGATRQTTGSAPSADPRGLGSSSRTASQVSGTCTYSPRRSLI